jgi:hypothetical protein
MGYFSLGDKLIGRANFMCRAGVIEFVEIVPHELDEMRIFSRGGLKFREYQI